MIVKRKTKTFGTVGKAVGLGAAGLAIGGAAYGAYKAGKTTKNALTGKMGDENVEPGKE